MATGDDFIQGDLYEAWLDALDENILDENFESLFDEHVEEMSNVGTFGCEMCSKTYKTKSGLNRHRNKKHMEGSKNNQDMAPPTISSSTEDVAINVNTLTHTNLIELMREVQKNLSHDECFNQEIRFNVAKYDLPSANDQLLLDIKKIQERFIKKSDADEFYSVFYSEIVMNSSYYFEGLKPQLSTLFMTRLADKILYFTHKEPISTKLTNIKPISEREYDGLQYLSGYVVFKLLKKIRKCKQYNSHENQYTVKILTEMKTDSFADQKLVHSLNRGGLYAVTPECQALFRRAEEQFRIETNKTSIRIINIEQMTKSLMNDKDIISTYNSIVENCSGTEFYSEIKNNLLHKLLQLYLRVRAFSLAKDITDKSKFENKSGKKKFKKRY